VNGQHRANWPTGEHAEPGGFCPNGNVLVSTGDDVGVSALSADSVCGSGAAVGDDSTPHAINSDVQTANNQARDCE
jgi:hypothetical protein